jgi:Glycosyltransferase family 87
MATPGLRDRAANLKGTDFLHFYTLGWPALAHRGADLYKSQAQSELTAHRVQAAAGIRHLTFYPPQVSIPFVPFARLSYPWALFFWLSLRYAVCCYAVWRACPSLPKRGLTVFILAIGFPAFWHLIAWGQTSALALSLVSR